MAKGSIIRALMGMKHSPAGKKFLKKKKDKGTEQTYFKGKRFQRKTIEQRLIDAGISEGELLRLKGKKSK